MGSYQRQRSRSTAGIEPHVREWKTYKKEKAGKHLTHSHTMTPFDDPGKQAFRKQCGKRRNCLYQAISPFATVFSTRLNNFLPFSSNFKLSSAKSFNLEES